MIRLRLCERIKGEDVKKLNRQPETNMSNAKVASNDVAGAFFRKAGAAPCRFEHLDASRLMPPTFLSVFEVQEGFV